MKSASAQHHENYHSAPLRRPPETASKQNVLTFGLAVYKPGEHAKTHTQLFFGEPDRPAVY